MEIVQIKGITIVDTPWSSIQKGSIAYKVFRSYFFQLFSVKFLHKVDEILSKCRELNRYGLTLIIKAKKCEHDLENC